MNQEKMNQEKMIDVIIEELIDQLHYKFSEILCEDKQEVIDAILGEIAHLAAEEIEKNKLKTKKQVQKVVEKIIAKRIDYTFEQIIFGYVKELFDKHDAEKKQEPESCDECEYKDECPDAALDEGAQEESKKQKLN